MAIFFDIISRTTDRYVLSGDGMHPYGLFFKEELEHIIKCANNTLEMYERNGITNSFISEKDKEELANISNYGYYSKKKENNNGKISDDLYLIIDEVSNRLKIGRSKNVNKRLNQLQVNNSGLLKILYVVSGRGMDESHVHEKFKKFRVLGEWFENDESIIDYFKKLTT